jgi:hypothetical protein
VAYPEDFDALLPANKVDFDRLPTKTQVARCIHMLEAQVNNGGFHQFFFNSSGEYVPETLTALGDIGAHETRALMERAVAVAYPSGYPLDARQHQEALEEFEDVASDLASLDTAFFSYTEPLADLVNAYLSRDT